MPAAKLTSDLVSQDRQETAEIQAARTHPHRHVFLKEMQGPFSVIQGDIAAKTGYRIFVHSVTLSGVNSAATDMSAVTYAGYIDGAAVFFASCPMVPNVANANAFAMPVDAIFDAGTAVSFIVFGTSYVSAFGAASFTYIKEGEE